MSVYDELHTKRMRKRARTAAGSAIRRCNPKTTDQGHRYEQRGIVVYPPWVEDPQAFASYLLTLDGWDNERLTLDRIDNDRGYEPGNLRWATASEQSVNRSKRRSKQEVLDATYRRRFGRR